MDHSEAAAATYLTSIGFTDVVYEPDGNVPPDFLVDKRIAIEVRRPNQHHESGSEVSGLEIDASALRDQVRRLISSFGSAHDESWFISYSFHRPREPWKTLKRRVRDELASFIAQGVRQETKWDFGGGFKLEVMRASQVHRTFFVVGGSDDRDDGGWLVSEMARNLRICIEEKTRKRDKNARANYPVWWLLLVDHIGYGLPDRDDREQLASLMPPAPKWNKIILLNPLDHHAACVLQGNATQETVVGWPTRQEG